MHVMQTLRQKWERLFGKDKLGRTRVWDASVYENPETGDGITIIHHGLLDGALQEETRVITVGKNKGKKNETTPVQQAIAETQRRWTDKVQKESYQVLTTEGNLDYQLLTTAEGVCNTSMPMTFFPMLADKLNPNKKTQVLFPFIVQPKLDGLRCVVFKNASGKVVAQSRTGKLFPHVEHVLKECRELLETHPTLILDGELFTFEVPFETLAGLIKKEKISSQELTLLETCVNFHVYDCMDYANKKRTFQDRHNNLLSPLLSSLSSSPLILVETKWVASWDEFREEFASYISQGYEGIMVRKPDGVYGENMRSSDLLKYKEFMEDEFVLSGFKEGTGRDTGTVIWECKTPEGRTFHVRPQGTLEHRRDLFLRATEQMGKRLTVKYQELSEQGVPRFPVGKDIREEY